MIILKILMWIVVIVLALVLLAILGILAALLVKIQVNFDYTAEGAKLKLKYGFIGLKLLPKKVKSEEEKAAKKAKSKKVVNSVKYHVEPYARKVADKAKDSIAQKAEVLSVEREIREEEELLMEQNRIDEENARINAEMKKAEEEMFAAISAEANGKALPSVVVDESRVSKLQGIKDSLAAFDFEKAYHSVISFVNGFDFASAVALIKFIGTESKGTLGKAGKRVVFKNVDVNLGVHGPNSATTALAYGAISSVCNPALEKFQKVANVKKSAVNIHPEFLEEADNADIHFNFGFRPLWVVAPFIPLMMKVSGKAIPFAKKTSKTIKNNKAALEKKTEARRKEQYKSM